MDDEKLVDAIRKALKEVDLFEIANEDLIHMDHLVKFVRAVEAHAGTDLTFANALITELCEHEGAEGFSDSTNKLLEEWDLRMKKVKP